MTDRSNKFIKQTLINEGLLVNDPNDSGGATLYGIASKDHPAEVRQMMGLYSSGDKEGALNIAETIYEKQYYNPLYENISSEQVAFRLFDFGVNAGVHTAVKHLQQTLGITEDGIFGQDTLQHANNAGDALYENYNNNLKAFYQSLVENNPKDGKFLKGWLARLDSTV